MTNSTSYNAVKYETVFYFDRDGKKLRESHIFTVDELGSSQKFVKRLFKICNKPFPQVRVLIYFVALSVTWTLILFTQCFNDSKAPL